MVGSGDQPRGASAAGGVTVGEQDATSAWQEATPTAAKISNRPMNLRKELGMAMDSLDSGEYG